MTTLITTSKKLGFEGMEATMLKGPGENTVFERHTQKFSLQNFGVLFPPIMGYAFHESFLCEMFTSY